MSKPIFFLERLIKVASKTENVDFLVEVLFDLKRNQENHKRKVKS